MPMKSINLRYQGIQEALTNIMNSFQVKFLKTILIVANIK